MESSSPYWHPTATAVRAAAARADEGIVNRWLFVRYLVIGLYVGCVTCAGFAWWYISAPVRQWAPCRVISWHDWASPQRQCLLHGGNMTFC